MFLYSLFRYMFPGSVDGTETYGYIIDSPGLPLACGVSRRISFGVRGMCYCGLLARNMAISESKCFMMSSR